MVPSQSSGERRWRRPKKNIRVLRQKDGVASLYQDSGYMSLEVPGWVTVSPEGPKGSSVLGLALLNNDVAKVLPTRREREAWT